MKERLGSETEVRLESRFAWGMKDLRKTGTEPTGRGSPGATGLPDRDIQIFPEGLLCIMNTNSQWSRVGKL